METSYRDLRLFLRYNGDERFCGADGSLSLWLVRLREKITSVDPAIKLYNKEAEMATATSNRDKQMDDSQTNFQTDLVSKCVVEVAKSPKIRELIQDLRQATSRDDLDSKGGENLYRYMLEAVLLVLGNGQRGDTIANMKIGELLDGKKKSGMKVVKVAHHKTKGTWGAANVSFALKGLWGATKKYVQLYR